MMWSTRELAERAGTTVNTIRHYHRLGLLAEPEREDNGYKRYETGHLLSLLRIRRLAELGVPLSQIGEVRASTDSTLQTMRELDAEFAQSIHRMEQARADIAAVLRDQVADPPAAADESDEGD